MLSVLLLYYITAVDTANLFSFLFFKTSPSQSPQLFHDDTHSRIEQYATR